MGSTWNWDAEAGNLTVTDFPAPTCALCHMSGFGANGTTHDVGDRLSWYLFASISQQRPNWEDNRSHMQSVCFECHNKNFITNLYTGADAATQQVNDWVKDSNDLVAPLQEQGLINTANLMSRSISPTSTYGTIGGARPNLARGCKDQTTPNGMGLIHSRKRWLT
jgi:hypothetical protein